MNKKVLAGTATTVAVAALIGGLVLFGVNTAGAGSAPIPTPIVDTQTPSPSPTVTPTPTPTVSPVVQAPAAPAPADPAPAPDDSATQSDPQQADPAPADPAPADPGPAPAQCPGDSTVYSADDAGNPTACLPNVCLTLPSMPDPAHPECDAPFRP